MNPDDPCRFLPFEFWTKPFIGTRKPLTGKEKAHKRAKRKLAKKSKKRNN